MSTEGELPNALIIFTTAKLYLAEVRRPNISGTVHQEKHLQEQYYAQTAAFYDTMHSTEWNEHSVALEHVKRICLQLGLKSVLDVGCGTGAAVRTLLDCGFQAMGVEPVRALIDIGVQSRKLAEDQVLQGSAEGLGFPDRSFDAVCEFAVGLTP